MRQATQLQEAGQQACTQGTAGVNNLFCKRQAGGSFFTHRSGGAEVQVPAGAVDSTGSAPAWWAGSDPQGSLWGVAGLDSGAAETGWAWGAAKRAWGVAVRASGVAAGWGLAGEAGLGRAAVAAGRSASQVGRAGMLAWECCRPRNDC